MHNTQLATYTPSANPIMVSALTGLRQEIHNAALAELGIILEEDPSYTETEKEAMLVVQELRLVNGLDLAAVLYRGELLRTISERNLVASHPGRYATLQEMASDQGISTAELSKTRDLVEVVFPYITNELGMSVPDLWEKIGKSKFTDLIPVIKSLITGEESSAQSVRDATERILDDVAATAQATGQELTEAEARREAIEQLLEDGQRLTGRQLRQRIRPERIVPIQISVIEVDGQRVLVAHIEDENQWLSLQRRAGNSIDFHSVSLPRDSRQRQVEAARIPELRALLNLLGG